MIFIHCSMPDLSQKVIDILPSSIMRKIKNAKHSTTNGFECFKFYGQFSDADLVTFIKTVKDNKVPDSGYGPDVSMTDNFIELCIPSSKSQGWI